MSTPSIIALENQEEYTYAFTDDRWNSPRVSGDKPPYHDSKWRRPTDALEQDN